MPAPDLAAPGERLATLVPAPRHVRTAEGTFELGATTTLLLDAAPELEAALLGAVELLPFRPQQVSDRRASDQIRVHVAADLTPPEGYRLDVSTDGIAIEAHDLAGVVYAIQTLRQLMPPAVYRHLPPRATAWVVPAVQIEDSPRFAWRGVLIDVARHFLPKHELLRHIDVLAAHKFNRIQLHLTDDQGWRVESKAFPRLHEVGSVRAETQMTHALHANPEFGGTPGSDVFDGTPHGGYYTHEDLREIVAYARQRAVTIVPEIELPGHCGAMLAAYPEIGSPPDRPREVGTRWGCGDALLSLTPRTMAFLDTLLAELFEIFDSPWLHIGADESDLSPWTTDQEVREIAREQGLAGPADVYMRFIENVEQIAQRHGRRMVTWDEGFTSKVNAPAAKGTSHVVMVWRDANVAQRAIRAGHDAILAPVIPTYFDYYEARDEREPLAQGGPITVEDVVTWQPIVPEEWTAEEAAHVLGIQCQIWSEFTGPSPRRLDYMLYPRAVAFAEVAWADTADSLAQVEPRLRAHLARLSAASVEFRPLDGPAPWQEGGTGNRAFRAGWPMSELEELLRADIDAGPAATWPAADDSPPS